MKLISFLNPAGESRLGVLGDGDSVHDITDRVPAGVGLSPMRRLLNTEDPLKRVSDLVDQKKAFDLGEIMLQPPVPDPTKIVAAPVNYFDHKEEMNEATHIDALGVFLKAPSSLLADGGTVRLPYSDRRFDQEGEFAAIIGRTASHVTVDEALDHVAGYSCLLDMTMRGGEDRSVRKSFDTFTPVGPWLITGDEMPPIDTLELRCWVAGALRQDADLRDLIWALPKLIAYVSSVMTLYPGDIVTTGTPAGVGPVADGDEVAVEISGLGRLAVTVSADRATSCPTLGARTGPTPPSTQTRVRTRQP